MADCNKRLVWLIFAVLLIIVLILFYKNHLVWLPERSGEQTVFPTNTVTLTVNPAQAHSWPGPIGTPVTPVPAPLTGINTHDEVESIILLGQDQDFPFSGRSNAIFLILYNRRTSMASIISIPPDLFVYIPGYAMQRINSAYAVGGIDLVKDTLEYNLGINPDHFLVVQYSDFPRMIDAVGGIDVVVIDDLTDPCQLAPGSTHMNGTQAFCYARYRRGEDDMDRIQRQLQLMRAFFLRMMVDGRIASLPVLYAEFQETVPSDLTLNDLLMDIHLGTMLADPQRIGYFQISWDEVTQWLMPGRAKTIVLLPKQTSILELIQAAVEFVMSPAPFSDLSITLQAQLTQTQLVTLTPTPSPQIATPTPGMEDTPFAVTPTETPTPTPTGEGFPYP
ncbi:MAG: LCP family protein [Anaerolineaceae bacterium]|nr:LCP family protein [Anaerolineaceae bacterium]MBN2677500.1 LCP family protein [Anaerolineaceae bacterium]